MSDGTRIELVAVRSQPLVNAAEVPPQQEAGVMPGHQDVYVEVVGGPEEAPGGENLCCRVTCVSAQCLSSVGGLIGGLAGVSTGGVTRGLMGLAAGVSSGAVLSCAIGTITAIVKRGA